MTKEKSKILIILQKRKIGKFWKECGNFREKYRSRRMLWNIQENWFTSSRANDAMIIFSTPSRGQQVLTPLGSEQTTSLLVVLIILKIKRKEFLPSQIIFVTDLLFVLRILEIFKEIGWNRKAVIFFNHKLEIITAFFVEK